MAFEVWDEQAQADGNIHFAVFFWTDPLLTDRVIEKLGDGVEVYGMFDQLGEANGSSGDEAMCAAGAQIGVEDFICKLHDMFAVIDVNGPDPTVILGSYRTQSGAHNNDENTLIIHDTALTQAYYAEWQRL